MCEKLVVVVELLWGEWVVVNNDSVTFSHARELLFRAWPRHYVWSTTSLNHFSRELSPADCRFFTFCDVVSVDLWFWRRHAYDFHGSFITRENYHPADVSIHAFRQLRTYVSVRNQFRVDAWCCRARESRHLYTCVYVRNHFIRDCLWCQRFSRMKKTEPSFRPGLYSPFILEIYFIYTRVP